MNIYVGNLPLEATEDDLRRMFVDFGEVISVIIMNDKYIGSGQPRVYGYVQMPSKSQGQTAVVGLQEKNFGGQLIKVVEALPLSDSAQAPTRKRGRFSGLETRKRTD